jgi:hypothetical protein
MVPAMVRLPVARTVAPSMRQTPSAVFIEFFAAIAVAPFEVFACLYWVFISGALSQDTPIHIKSGFANGRGAVLCYNGAVAYIGNEIDFLEIDRAIFAGHTGTAFGLHGKFDVCIFAIGCRFALCY